MMHCPLVRQLDHPDFRATFAAAFGKEPVVFDNLSLYQGTPPLSYEALLTLIQHNSFMEMHPHSWRNSYEVLAPSIRLAKSGKLIDPSAYQRDGFDDFGVGVNHFSVERIRSLVCDGATLIFNSVDKVVPTLGDAVAETRAALGALCSLNAYYTPVSNMGFGPHWDDHDVIIFQLDGRADWRLLANSTRDPHRSVPKIAGEPPPINSFETVKVTQGQALYIPRGHWHFKQAIDDNSLHLTLGIHLPTIAEKISSVLLSSHKREHPRLRVISKELQALGVISPDIWEDMVIPSLEAIRDEITVSERKTP
jgi:ribosomal protein L16 Arg81 hydroxylase